MKIQTTVLLVRHAEYDTTIESSDPPLSAQGREQAQKLGQWLKANYMIDAIYSSTLARARETAEIVNESLSLLIAFKDELQEFSVWPLLPTFPQLFDPEDLFGKHHQEKLPVEYWSFAEQVFGTFKEIIQTHRGKIILIIAHGHVVGTIVRCLTGGHRMAIHSEPTGVTQIQHWDDGVWEIDFLNRREHLP
ncbi:histidine phosphatase family protein [Candidatus Acetothermia bacterium]|nr:histidine phosphatase family protein [Candidatus Acetothermia bacterium]